MYSVGRFISRGVYTVAGPFHPFGGAVDIIVVKQQDGSFKSSPWYVRFGKFQGVLKTKEKVVNICVNGKDADFHMYLDHKGETYFLKEVEVEEGDSLLSSSSDEKDGIFQDNQRPLESKSFNFGDGSLSTVDQSVLSNGKMMTRSTSRKLRLFGLVFGRKSMKESQYDREDDSTQRRIDSLERAEYAAELLEVKWSTNLASNKSRKDNVPSCCGPNMLNSEAHNVTQIDAERSQQSSPFYDDSKNSMDQDSSSGNVQEGNQGFENYGQKTTLEVSRSSTPDNRVVSSTEGECVSESKCMVGSEICDESMLLVAEDEKNPERILSGISVSGFHVLHPMELEEYTDQHFDKEYSSHNKNVVLPSCSICLEENRIDKVGSFLYSEPSETSMVQKEGAPNKQTYEAPYNDGECGKVHFQTEILQSSTQLPSKDDTMEQYAENVRFTGLEEVNERFIHPMNPSLSFACNDNVLHKKAPTSLSRNPMLGLVELIDSDSICAICNISDSGCLVQDDKIMKDGSSTTNSELSSKSIREHVATEDPTLHGTHCHGEEQFLFSDIDDSNIHEIHKMELNFSLNVDGENCCSHSQEGIAVLNGPGNKSNEPHSSPVMFADEIPLIDLENSIGSLRESSKPMDIPRNLTDTGNKVRLAESMPIRLCDESFGVHDILHLCHSLDSNSRKLDGDKVQQLSSRVPGIKDAHLPAELESVPADAALGISSQPSLSSSGRWRLWPFSFRRSTSSVEAIPLASDNSNADNAIENKTGNNQINTSNSSVDDVSDNKISKNGNNIGGSIADIASERKIDMSGNNDELKPRVVKKMVRITSPTSEQLASLNLKEGRNTVTFTFSTAMLGNQQIEARIYLWKWNTRIVISDVDGTITRSDLLGQFMPLVGVDWSQTGVTNLFSAIKENGYQILFLSARAISQAYCTRQFLFNLKQDGKALPDGPMVISPDGLFPSLYREVIRRAPHEFKIGCLEEIRSLFPPDCNPFYAGFGNRDTDEFSYLKVGIPKGKIFTINSKGEVAVNHRHDTRSYTSLHGLVNGMFPSTSVSEKEDFNSWNFWKIPPPAINV